MAPGSAAPVAVPVPSPESTASAVPSPSPLRSVPVARADCWAPPSPLHLARLEVGYAEDHILRGLD
ncbi:hypothetical protein [Streptomyces apricus]|uniref:Uncharacterized protein n=1 Tax=Streptomyces apricus TaxID=1828112 RepID=A0A5B0AM63_9ACTN|nr:hypothetical protein [Streptomyces apricus]KAA0929695.1 hypothetical protein FGF04_30255 [Streptomyces apricus]